MKIDDAILAHVEWKDRLSNYLRRADRSLLPREIAADNGCELGKWLYGEGRPFAEHQEYADVIQQHIRFHTAATSVLRRANAGESVYDDIVLGSGSDFVMASVELINALMALRQVIS